MSIININDLSFEKSINNGLSIVDFWSTYCGPCKMFGPVFEAVSNKIQNVNFYKFEITDDSNTRQTPMKYGIRSIPSILAFKDGKLIDTKVGLMDGETFEDWIESLKNN